MNITIFHSILLFLFLFSINQSINTDPTNCEDYIDNFPDYFCVKSESIGAGSSGEAFLVKKDGIKYMMKSQLNTPKSEIEVDFLNKLKDNPYVVSIYDSIIIKKKMIFIMQFGEKGTLLKTILGSDPYFSSFKNCLTFFKELAEGVRLMHEKNIVHADLKLENIVVTSDNKPLIIDFDLALPSGKVDNVRGTKSYMPPELIRALKKGNNPTYTPSDDLYSMGIIFYEMVTKNFPLVYPPFDLNIMLDTSINFKAGDPIDFKKIVSSLVCLKEQRINDEQLHDELVEILLKNDFETLDKNQFYTLNSAISGYYDLDSEFDSEEESEEESSIIDIKITNLEIFIIVAFVLLIIGIIFLVVWFGNKTKNRILQNSFNQKLAPGQTAFDLETNTSAN